MSRNKTIEALKIQFVLFIQQSMIFAFGDLLQIESVNGAHGVYGLGAQKLATEEDEP